MAHQHPPITLKRQSDIGEQVSRDLSRPQAMASSIPNNNKKGRKVGHVTGVRSKQQHGASGGAFSAAGENPMGAVPVISQKFPDPQQFIHLDHLQQQYYEYNLQPVAKKPFLQSSYTQWSHLSNDELGQHQAQYRHNGEQQQTRGQHWAGPARFPEDLIDADFMNHQQNRILVSPPHEMIKEDPWPYDPDSFAAMASASSPETVAELLDELGSSASPPLVSSPLAALSSYPWMTDGVDAGKGGNEDGGLGRGLGLDSNVMFPSVTAITREGGQQPTTAAVTELYQRWAEE